MRDVVMYTSEFCPFCRRALQLLKQKNAPLTLISVDDEPDVRAAMAEKTGRTSVPQIWIGETHVGGCDELHALEAEGKLDAMLAG